MRPYLDLSLLRPGRVFYDPFKTIDTEPSSKVPASRGNFCRHAFPA
jgi:hypothetical protein